MPRLFRYPSENTLSICRLWLEGGWLFGVAILLLQLSTMYMPAGEPRDWFQYYAIGAWAVVFLIGHAATAWWRLFSERKWWVYASAIIKVLCTFYTVFMVSDIFLPAILHEFFIPVFVIVTIILCHWMCDFVTVRHMGAKVCYALTMGWLLLACFAVFLKLLSRHQGIFLDPALQHSFLLVVSLAFVGIAVWMPLKVQRENTPFWHYPAHCIVVYLLMCICFQTNGVVSHGAFMDHWKAMLEPAASIRTGGWPLWDVPIQYGFFQAIFIALWPAGSVWQSLYLLNGTLLLVCYYMIFAVLFTRHRGIFGYIFCCVMVIYVSSVLLLGSDSRIIPSAGPMRFIWAYAIAGYVFYISRRLRDAPLPPLRISSLFWGNILWICGVLWAFESAIFVTLMWLPCIVLYAAAEEYRSDSNAFPPAIARHILCRLGDTVLLLGCALLSIIAVYIIFLGHLPEFRLFWMYAGLYKGGFAAFPIKSIGGISCLIFLFLFMTYVAALYVRNSLASHNLPHIAVLWVCISGLWVVSSYYVSRSDEGHVGSVLPIAVYMLSIFWASLPSLTLPFALQEGFKVFVTFFFAVLFFMATILINPATLFKSFSGMAPIIADITTMLPAPPRAVRDAVRGVPAGAPVFDLTANESYSIPHIRPWILPNTLVSWLKPLPLDTYQRMAERGAERGCQYGWVVENNQRRLNNNYPWIRQAIEKYYVQVAVQGNKRYTLLLYKKKIPANC